MVVPLAGLLAAICATAPVTSLSRGRVTGRVLQVTTDEAYISLGARHGLTPGDTVRLRLADGSRGEARVLDVWRSGARIAVDPRRALPRRRGRVWATIGEEQKQRPPKRRPIKRLPAPEGEVVMAARWRGVPLKRPRKVIHRDGRGKGGAPVEQRLRALLRVEYMGLFDMGSAPQDHYHQLGLLSDLQIPRLFVDWLDYSHRLRLRFDLARDLDRRPSQQSRPYLLVHRLRAGLRLGRLSARVGRMTAGQLPVSSLVDGTSIRVRIGSSLYLGAFGGLSPRMADLRPSAASGRFGGYASVRLAPKAGDRWHAALDAGFVGTTWEGNMDRRAMTAQLSLHALSSWLDVTAVVDQYGSGHPARQPGLDLSLLSVELRSEPVRWLRLDARFDRYRPFVSFEMLDLYALQAPLVDEAAQGVRGSVQLLLPARLELIGEVGWDEESGWSDVVFGGGSLRRGSNLVQGDLIWIALNASSGSLLTDVGGDVGVTVPFGETFSATVAYGLSRFDYLLDDGGGGTLRHDATLGFDIVVVPHWMATLDTSFQVADLGALILFATLGYRY